MDGLLAAPDADFLAARLTEMLAAGRTGAARPMLAALRRLTPPSPLLAELGALLALHEGRLGDARVELDVAIAAHPDHAGLRRCRADIRHRAGDISGASHDAAEAVVLEPANVAGKAILGILMMEGGRPADAVRCLAEARASLPADAAICEALSQAQAAAGDVEDAAATLAAGVAASPGSMSLRNASVLLAVRRRAFASAVALAEDARRDGMVDACLFGLKGHALTSLGRHDEAAEAYQEALKLGPEDPYVRHLVAAAGGVAGTDRAPADYLSAVFDGYADRFEAHLIALGYRIPGVIRTALPHHARLRDDGTYGPALDLGCGTGLVSVALSDLPIGPITGVDVSARMLAKAASKQLYANLRQVDVLDFLKEPGPGFALAFAADLLCYFGALDGVTRAVRQRLDPGGLFFLSVERTESVTDRGWVLGRHGRYAHTAAYLSATANAAGFTIVSLDPEVIRTEAGAPAHGLFAVLRCPDLAG